MILTGAKSMIENRQLRYFVTAARLLHITRAAEVLHIAQPALTQNIRQLEQVMGVQLFHRIRKRVSLTEAGEVFCAEAERVLRQVEYAVLAAQKAARGEMGKLAIGFISTAGLILVPRIVSAFRRYYPNPIIQLYELRAAEVESELRNGMIDVGLLYGPPRDSEFAVRQLQADRLVVALPRSHRLSKQRTVDLQDLGGDHFILPTQENAGSLLDAILTECQHSNFRPKMDGEIKTATVQTTLGMVAAGIGVSIVPGGVQRFARNGVVFRPIRRAKVAVSLNLLWRSGDTAPVLQNLLRSLP
jgi:DNA-binding transcriptional LysR family regulator